MEFIQKKIWWTQICLHPHTILRSQVWNILWKWKQNQGSTVFFSLPKRPELRRLLANQNDKGSLQKTHWRSSTSNRKVWWTLITKSSMRRVNHGTIRYFFVALHLATQWIQSYPCKTQTHMRRREVCRNYWSHKPKIVHTNKWLNGIWEEDPS